MFTRHYYYYRSILDGSEPVNLMLLSPMLVEQLRGRKGGEGRAGKEGRGRKRGEGSADQNVINSIIITVFKNY